MAAQREVVIGVDIGTTSAKAVAFDADAREHGRGQAGYEMRAPRPGWEEQDPGEVAAATFEAASAAARAAEEAGAAVVGIGFSAAMHGLLGLDGAGEPITPLVTWADARASEQARELRREVDPVALQRRTGTPVHPMSPLVKLRWFGEHEPELAGRVDRWAGMKELVVSRLTGELVSDHGIASATGLLELDSLRWDEDALELAGVDEASLPEPVPTETTVGLSSEGARLTGLSEGLPVVLGSGDGPLANLGLGAIRPGAVACSIGTSGAVRVVVDAPRVDERGRAFCYVLSSGLYAVGGAVNNGGVVLDWAAEALAPDLAGKRSAEELLELAAEAPPGSGGLLFLPYLLGERAPHWQGRPSGAFLGLRREHRREHMLRAVIEGVSLQLAVVLDSLLDAGIEVREVRATGGFSRSALWRRVLAGAFDRELGFAESPEASSLGAALLAMDALGMNASLERAAELIEVADHERPDPDDVAALAALKPPFDHAYEALGDSFEALADLQETLSPIA